MWETLWKLWKTGGLSMNEEILLEYETLYPDDKLYSGLVTEDD